MVLRVWFFLDFFSIFYLSIKLLLMFILGIPVLLPILLLSQSQLISTTNITQMEALYQQLVSGYNTVLLPRETDENPVNIKVSVHLLSIDHFDEISGILKTIMQFELEWSDFRVGWRSSDFGGMESFQMPSASVWKPAIYLLESAFKFEPIGASETETVRITSNGTVLWSPGQIVYSSCSVDVLNFPFDLQICYLNFMPKNTLAVEVVLNATSNQLRLRHYVANSKWGLVENVVDTTNLGSNGGGVSSLNLKLYLQRRNLFYVYYILCPLFFLAFLNKLVFFMLPDSGERTGVAVTIFLAFVVYMDVINSNVPASSNPVAFIYIVVLILMMYSVLIMLMCIVSSRIYMKTTEVPVLVQKTVAFLRLEWLRNRKISSADVVPTTNEMGHTQPDKATGLENQCRQDIMSWAIVGKTVDIYCYITCVIFLTIVLIVSMMNSS